ncbi:MAG: S41 family peptidase [Woeseiaceae bacterium]|nr:S41 family peptidase [Woeseiaceae bacterium]
MLNIRPAVSLPGLALAAAAIAAQPGSIPVPVLKADFGALYAGLANAHYDLYAHRSKAEYDRLFEEMLAGLETPLTRQEAEVLFQQFVAFGNVAHARIGYDRTAFDEYRAGGGRLFPIDLRIVDGRSYVQANHSGNAVLEPGTEILTLNGTPMTDWLERTSRYLSADTPYIAHSLLEFQFPMYLWQDAGPVDAFTLEIRSADGERRSVHVPALTAGQIEAHREAAEASFALDPTAREARMLDGDIAYLRPGPFYNAENPESLWDNTDFVRFIDDAFAGFIDAGATALLIDLRQNPGGDNSFSDPMIAWFATEPFRFASSFRIRSSAEARASNQARLDNNPGQATGVSAFFAERYAAVPYGETFEYTIPEVKPREAGRFDAQVYVLVDRHSYSNAVTVAATVQDYGFGIVVGEKTSDMATTYGAMETFRLPNTGIVVGFPKAHIVRPSGELQSDGVTPDLPIPSPIVPTASDTILEKALARIRESTADQ